MDALQILKNVHVLLRTLVEIVMHSSTMLVLRCLGKGRPLVLLLFNQTLLLDGDTTWRRITDIILSSPIDSNLYWYPSITKKVFRLQVLSYLFGGHFLFHLYQNIHLIDKVFFGVVVTLKTDQLSPLKSDKFSMVKSYKVFSLHRLKH